MDLMQEIKDNIVSIKIITLIMFTLLAPYIYWYVYEYCIRFLCRWRPNAKANTKFKFRVGVLYL